MHPFEAICAPEPFRPELFDISSLDDEIRVDHLCEQLLRAFCKELIENDKQLPEMAGAHARGADYLLREFIIGDRRENLLRIGPQRIRQFAGNWYITKTLEPNRKELQSILQGTAQFYKMLARFELYPQQQADQIAEFSRDLDYYQQRIDDFWKIEQGGFHDWSAACPIDS